MSCRRSKYGDDPNNTTWVNSTDKYGHKILRKQGWTPGSLLGAQDAPHSRHFTSASASHIRVSAKDDSLGLGARPDQLRIEALNRLGAFSDVLARLNGKPHKQIAEEEKVRADLGRKLYADEKYGPARFVRGGFLIGDRIEERKPNNDPSVKESESTFGQKEHAPEKVTDHASEQSNEPKQKKKPRRKQEPVTQTAPSLDYTSRPTNHERQPHDKVEKIQQSSNEEKSSERSKKRHRDKTDAKDATVKPEKDKILVDRDKAERKQRRAEKRLRKENRRLKNLSKLTEVEKKRESDANPKPKDGSSVTDTTTRSNVSSITRTWTHSGGRAPIDPRSYVRQRSIQQKRLSLQDPEALKQV